MLTSIDVTPQPLASGVLTVGTMGGSVGATVTGRTAAKGDLGRTDRMNGGVLMTLTYNKNDTNNDNILM